MTGLGATDSTVSAEQTERGDDSDRDLRRGQLVGRYVVLEAVGRGAMGTVYAALDPELDRRVAIKVLRSRATPGRSARLLREAQAIARLSHPNVVAVHDVGVVAGQVFVAMEFIAGPTLRRWLAAAERGATAILSMFAGTGRGLAAAHDAGLVHRDFKPGNVIVAEDGRPRVVDFGLVRALEPETDAGDDCSQRTASGLGLTETGAVMGTPAYMAPEQFEGRDVGSAADQFAFCVALCEALFGERPFAGDSVAELRAAVTQGRRRPLPRRRGVSSRVSEALARGLSADPDARYPSMRELLAQLSPPGKPRGRALILPAAVGLLAAGAVLAVARDDGIDPCARGEERIAEVWSPAVRDRAIARLTASDRTYASATADHVVTGIDHYAREWVEMYGDACRATRELQAQSAELLDRRMNCLDARRRALAATVDVLAEADSTAIDHGDEVVAALPSIRACGSIDALSSITPLPSDPDLRARIEATRERLARGRALLAAGKYEAAVAAAEAVERDAHAIGYGPLVARTHFLAGESLLRLHRYDDSESELDTALTAAQTTGQDRLVTSILGQLLWITGGSATRGREADRLHSLANATIVRLGGDPELTARMSVQYARSLWTRGRHREALAEQQRALELLIPLGDPARTGIAYFGVGRSQFELGDLDEAAESLQRSHDALATSLGSDHPRTLLVLGSIAAMHILRDEGDAALPLLESTLAARERNLGPTHPDVAEAALNLGITLYELGLEGRARRALERAVRIYGDDPEGTQALFALAVIERKAGRLERSLELQSTAYDLIRRHKGPEHPDLCVAMADRATVYRLLGRLEEAERETDRAVELAERVLAPPHPNLNRVRIIAAETLAAVDRQREAMDLLQQAVRDERERDRDGTLLASASFALAKLRMRGDPAAALALAEQARGIYAARPHAVADLAEVEAWIERAHQR